MSPSLLGRTWPVGQALPELLLEIPGGEERFLLGVLSGVSLRGGGTEGGQSSASIKSGLVLFIHSPGSTAGSSTSSLCTTTGSKSCPEAAAFPQDAERSDAERRGRAHLPAAPAAPLRRRFPAPHVGPGQVPAGSRQKGDPGAAGNAGSPRHPAPAGPGEHPESAAALPAESGGAGEEPEPGGGGRGGSRVQNAAAAPPDPHLVGHPRGTPALPRTPGRPGPPGAPRSLPLPPPAVPHRRFPPAAPGAAGAAQTLQAAAVPSRRLGATAGHHLHLAGGSGDPPAPEQPRAGPGFPEPGADRSHPALGGRARGHAAPAAGFHRRRLGCLGHLRGGTAGAGGGNPGETGSGGQESSGAGGGVREERREVLPEVAEGLLPGHRLVGLGHRPQQLLHEVLRGLLPPQLQTGQHARPDPIPRAFPVQGRAPALLRARRLRPHGADAPGQRGQAGVQPLRGHAGHQVPLCLRAALAAPAQGGMCHRPGGSKAIPTPGSSSIPKSGSCGTEGLQASPGSTTELSHGVSSIPKPRSCGTKTWLCCPVQPWGLQL